MTTLSPRIAACLAATWFIWGSTYLTIKFALVSFPPFMQNGTRFLLAGSILLLWARWRGQPMPNLVQWRNATVVGSLMLAANVGGVAYAEQWLASGLVVAFIAIVPALITIASLPFGIRPTRMEVIGIGLGFAGVLLLVRGEAFTSSPIGVLAIVTAAVGWSTGSVPPQLLATAAWLYLSLFGSVIAYSAFMTLLANTRPALATSNSFVNPVIAMLLGVSLGGEMVTRQEWLAVGIIVAGVTVLVLNRR